MKMHAFLPVHEMKQTSGKSTNGQPNKEDKDADASVWPFSAFDETPRGLWGS
jgi:hypothetical protein